MPYNYAARTKVHVYQACPVAAPDTPAPRLSDAQVALNLQDRGWSAVDVVFVKSAAPEAIAEALKSGRRYTYKSHDLSPGAESPYTGRAAHVDVTGSLRSVIIAEVRKPTARDMQTAHRHLLYVSTEAYNEHVKRDAELLARIEAAS